MELLSAIYIGIAVLAVAAICIVALIKWLDSLDGYQIAVLGVIVLAVLAYGVVTIVSTYWKEILVVAVVVGLVIGGGYLIAHRDM